MNPFPLSGVEGILNRLPCCHQARFYTNRLHKAQVRSTSQPLCIELQFLSQLVGPVWTNNRMNLRVERSLIKVDHFNAVIKDEVREFHRVVNPFLL